MLRPTGHASRLTGDIMPRWVSFRSVLRCKSGLLPNQELLRVRSGWHGINLKAYSSTVYFAYHTFGYYKIKQTTLVLNKGKNQAKQTTRPCRHGDPLYSRTAWLDSSTAAIQATWYQCAKHTRSSHQITTARDPEELPQTRFTC